MRNVTAPIAAALLALGLPTAASAQADPHMPVLTGTRLDISAEGEVKRVPDIATISAGVVTQAPAAAAAISDNATRMAAVIAALKKAGIAASDIQTSSINLNPQYRYQNNQPPQLVGYQATNTVQVTFRKVAEAGRIIDALVAQGANQINGPNLAVDKPEAALDEARTQAIAAARARAEVYARAAGLKVKRILSISEQGGYQPPAPYPVARMAAAAPKADTEIEPGETRLSVTVNVSFELE